MTATGEPAPPGKCAASTFSPSIEGCVPRNDSSVVRPVAFSATMPRHATARIADVPIQVARGRRSMRPPTRAQKPCSDGSSSPSFGARGQKIHRPHVTRSAGSRVSMTSTATPTPTAATGPRPAVEFMVAKSRQSMPMATVAPDAMIAGLARCRARAMASWRSPCLRSSSR